MRKHREMTKKISTCTFGVLLTVMLAPAAVAHADQTDQDFNNFLQSHGVNLGSPTFTVNAAHTMCSDLAAGLTEGDQVSQLAGAHRLNWDQAQTFVAAATADYCPQHHPESNPK